MQEEPVPGRSPGTGSFRRALLGGAALLALAVGALAFASGRPAASDTRGARPVLPDLGVAPLPDPLIERAHTGQRRLRFTVSIANVGAGPIEVHGVRLTTRSPFSTWQWILRTDGSSVRVRTPSVRMVFVGTESHGHWHVRGAARYELRRLDRGTLVRVRMKRGFCLFDSTPYRRSIPGSPAERRYPREACGKQGALVFTMGISPGWKDDYYWRIPGQEIDVTNLPHGRYRLLVTVDPRNWFRESNERNNVAWVDFVLSDSLLVKVLGRSPRL